MTYVVRSGDTLFIIAEKFNTTVDAIMSVNPQISDPNIIYPGQVIVIPAKTEACPLLREGDRGPAVKRFQTLVQYAGYNPGPLDGIFGPRTKEALLAFQRSVKELEITGVVDEETWTALGANCEPFPGGTSYIVRKGDTLFIIASRFNLSVEDILRANPQITDPNLIYPGQLIIIPAR